MAIAVLHSGSEYQISVFNARTSCATDHMIRFPRPSPSIFAYCKQLNLEV